MKLRCMVGRHKMEIIKDETFTLLLDLALAGTTHICIKKCKYCKHVDIMIDKIKINEL